ncbi:MAG: 30S ribosomal protein S16 [Flavobacteriales bacterium]|nr:30S ribosomal protein S16 [Flavobacteriales bacterium]
MPTRIRLQRKGKKGRPYYHIVVADQRAPRDGKYIERIGAYDPNQNPALVQIDLDRAVNWMQMGAQPTDTCRAILSYRGVLYKNHLLNGVKKGAFDEAEAERRFDIWQNEKNTKIEDKRKMLGDAAEAAMKDRISGEIKKAEEMAAALSAKLAAATAEEAAPEAPAEEPPATEAPAEEAAPAAEEAPTPEEKSAGEEKPAE